MVEGRPGRRRRPQGQGVSTERRELDDPPAARALPRPRGPARVDTPGPSRTARQGLGPGPLSSRSARQVSESKVRSQPGASSGQVGGEVVDGDPVPLLGPSPARAGSTSGRRARRGRRGSPRPSSRPARASRGARASGWRSSAGGGRRSRPRSPGEAATSRSLSGSGTTSPTARARSIQSRVMSGRGSRASVIGPARTGSSSRRSRSRLKKVPCWVWRIGPSAIRCQAAASRKIGSRPSDSRTCRTAPASGRPLPLGQHGPGRVRGRRVDEQRRVARAEGRGPGRIPRPTRTGPPSAPRPGPRARSRRIAGLELDPQTVDSPSASPEAGQAWASASAIRPRAALRSVREPGRSAARRPGIRPGGRRSRRAVAPGLPPRSAPPERGVDLHQSRAVVPLQGGPVGDQGRVGGRDRRPRLDSIFGRVGHGRWSGPDSARPVPSVVRSIIDQRTTRGVWPIRRNSSRIASSSSARTNNTVSDSRPATSRARSSGRATPRSGSGRTSGSASPACGA